MSLAINTIVTQKIYKKKKKKAIYTLPKNAAIHTQNWKC